MKRQCLNGDRQGVTVALQREPDNDADRMYNKALYSS